MTEKTESGYNKGMTGVFRIMVMGLIAVWAVGCRPATPATPEIDIEGIKLKDLAAARGKQQPAERLRTASFNVYLFEIPAENIGRLRAMWEKVSANPMQFYDATAFAANSFCAGFGTSAVLGGVVDDLNAAGASKIQKYSLLLTRESPGEVFIAGIYAEQPLFYLEADGTAETLTVGRGRLVLRMRAERFPGLRDVCTVEAEPAIVGADGGLGASSGMPNAQEKELLALGFRVKMAAGDLVVLGPSSEVVSGMNLGAFFFNRAAPSSGGRMFLVLPGAKRQRPVPYYGPVVRIYMILCTDVNL